MLKVKILGTPRFERDGNAVTADTRKASALVAFLAVEGPTRRETLAGLLWPESAESQARSSLRRTLSALRSAMGSETVSSDRDQITLANDEVTTDLDEFRDALAETTSHDHDTGDVCGACIEPLRRAVTSYRGDFMAGFSIRDAPAYEDWTRATAEGLRLEVGRAYDKLATALAAEGDFRSAIEAVTSWLELDPLREPGYRQLMILNAWAGDGPGATEAYRRCVATLNEELGVDPLEETTELHEAILDDDLPPAPGMRKRVVARPTETRYGPSDLINREAERESLFTAARNLEDGHSIRIIGEPWLGKTRLLDELRIHNETHSIATVSARGYRAEEDLPFGVVSQLLTSLAGLGNWPNISSDMPEWVLNEAARLYPPLGDPRPSSIGDVLGETRLYDAVFKLLTATPKVLIVDDVQWADQSSLALLSYLTHRISGTRVVLVMAHRPGEDVSLVPLIEATRLTASSELLLLPLVSSDIEGMTEHPDRMINQTGGIPALVNEALHATAPEELMPGIRRFMDTRLAGLDNLSEQILTTAAVLHGTCDFDMLRSTSGRDEDEVVAAIETLIRRGILHATDKGNLGFAFANMESLIYERINPVRRRLLHRRAAEALERSAQPDTDAAIATALAQHYRESGQDERAGSWFLQAGDLSRQVFASTEAISSYQTALALGSRDVAPIHLSIGETLLFLGRFSEARAEFEKAAAFSTGAERSLSEHLIGETNRRLGRFDVAVTQFELAEENHPDRTALYCDWALALLRLGDRQGARERADRAVEASGGGSNANRSRALSVVGIVSDQHDESRRALEEALELAGDHPPLRMAALNALGYSYAQSGDDEQAIKLVEEALELAGVIGDGHRQAALYNHLADLHHKAGRDQQAESAMTEAVKLFAEVEPGAWEPEVWLLTRW